MKVFFQPRNILPHLVLGIFHLLYVYHKKLYLCLYKHHHRHHMVRYMLYLYRMSRHLNNI